MAIDRYLLNIECFENREFIYGIIDRTSNRVLDMTFIELTL